MPKKVLLAAITQTGIDTVTGVVQTVLKSIDLLLVAILSYQEMVELISLNCVRLGGKIPQPKKKDEPAKAEKRKIVSPPSVDSKKVSSWVGLFLLLFFFFSTACVFTWLVLVWF